jgi:hypothetical protein
VCCFRPSLMQLFPQQIREFLKKGEGLGIPATLRLLDAVSVQQTQRPTAFHICKTRGCYCCFELLMMGGVSPETCWALYKHGIINFDTLLHLVGYFCMNYIRIVINIYCRFFSISWSQWDVPLTTVECVSCE